MRKANISDAVAIIEFASTIEEGIMAGEDWTELKAASKLKSLREKQKYYKGLSFGTISAYGANGAIIHYKPTNDTNAKIGTDSLFLLDSGW